MKKEEFTSEEFLDKLEKDLQNKYQIGLHQLGVFGTKENNKLAQKGSLLKKIRKIKPKDYVKSIFRHGFKNRWDKLHSTLTGFGNISEIKNNSWNRKKDFLDYSYNDDSVLDKDIYDIIIAMPAYFEIGDSKHFFGYLEYSPDEKIRDGRHDLLKSKIFCKKDVPSEFIYGYVKKSKDKYELVKNRKHMSLLSVTEREEFIKDFCKEREINLEESVDRESKKDFFNLDQLVNKEIKLNESDNENSSKTKEKEDNVR